MRLRQGLRYLIIFLYNPHKDTDNMEYSLKTKLNI